MFHSNSRGRLNRTTPQNTFTMNHPDAIDMCWYTIQIQFSVLHELLCSTIIFVVVVVVVVVTNAFVVLVACVILHLSFFLVF